MKPKIKITKSRRPQLPVKGSLVLKSSKLAVESSFNRVMGIILKYPDKEFSLSDLAKEAGVAKPHIGAILKDLEKADFIVIEKLSKIWRIRANQQNWDFKKNKVVYNLNFIYQSRIVEFLNEYFKNPKNIILFGSFRKGEDLSSSDIDIAIESDEVDEYKTFGMRELTDFEKEAGRKIQIHLFNKKNVDINVFNNIANGIVLSGFLEVGL